MFDNQGVFQGSGMIPSALGLVFLQQMKGGNYTKFSQRLLEILEKIKTHEMHTILSLAYS